MRRGEREVKDRTEIDAIIRSSQVCRLGLSEGGQPYVVPLCFGYDGRAMYFHCAKEGRKLDILRRNNKVCLEFDIVEGLVEADQACRWGIRYRSVIAFGLAYPVADVAEKEQSLALIMGQYAQGTFAFPPEMLNRTAVVRIEIEAVTGKESRRRP